VPDLGTGPVSETTLIRLLVRLGAEPHSPISRSDGANGAPAVVALVRSRLHAEPPASRVVVSRTALLAATASHFDRRIALSASDFAKLPIHLFRLAWELSRDSLVSYCLLLFPGTARPAHRRDVARRPARAFLPGYRGCSYQARDSCLAVGCSLTSGAYCREHLD